jgi:hypothetical protein
MHLHLRYAIASSDCEHSEESTRGLGLGCFQLLQDEGARTIVDS